MKPDELERLLQEDDSIEPSSGFAERVMRTVREDAMDLGPLRFPWRRALPGFAICAVAFGIGILALPPGGTGAAGPDLVESALAILGRWFRSEVGALTVGSLVGSWILVRLSLRLAGSRS